MSMSPLAASRHRVARWYFLGIFLVFAAPALIAGWLVFTGYQPSVRAYGQPVTPQRNLRDEAVRVALTDGALYSWREVKPRLTLIALASPGCAVACIRVLTKMAAARVTLNQNMDRLRLLYLGAPPAGEAIDGVRNYWRLGRDVDHRLATFAPSAVDRVSALLVESNGTVLAFYPAGFDPNGLRKDLQRVIR